MGVGGWWYTSKCFGKRGGGLEMLSDQNLDPCLFHGEGEAVLPATGLDLVGLLFSAVVHFLL
jgi:hypothetical protein